MNRLLNSTSASTSKAPATGESALSLPRRGTPRFAPVPPPNRPPLEIPFPRCSVKGCIFPAASAGGSLCLIHDLAEKEPSLFLSVQPSTLCLDRAKYGIAESDFDDSRARDRRQLLNQLNRLRNEVA